MQFHVFTSRIFEEYGTPAHLLSKGTPPPTPGRKTSISFTVKLKQDCRTRTANNQKLRDFIGTVCVTRRSEADRETPTNAGIAHFHGPIDGSAYGDHGGAPAIYGIETALPASQYDDIVALMRGGRSPTTIAISENSLPFEEGFSIEKVWDTSKSFEISSVSFGFTIASDVPEAEDQPFWNITPPSPPPLAEITGRVTMLEAVLRSLNAKVSVLIVAAFLIGIALLLRN